MAEFLYDTANLTLGFDSTAQWGVHINVINLHTKSQEFVLAVDELPGIIEKH